MSAPKIPLSFVAFLERVVGLTLFRGQRPLCKVSWDHVEPEQLTGDEAQLASPVFGGARAVPEIARKVIVWTKGRDVGGTMLGGYRGLHRALTDKDDHLAPGEPSFVLSVAPQKETARQSIRFALGAAKANPAIARMIDRETVDGFEIVKPGGRRVIFMAVAGARAGSTLRGKDIKFLHITESSFLYDDDHVVCDKHIFEAARPRAREIFIESTPWLMSGLHYELHKANFGDPRHALVAFAPTAVVRDDAATLEMVRAEYERDPVAAERELGAVFMPGGMSVFFDGLESAIDETRPRALPFDPQYLHFDGEDFGFVNDSSVCVIVRRRGRCIELCDYLELRPQPGAPLKPSDVVARFAEFRRRYGLESLPAMSDGHYREAIREHLAAHKMALAAAPEGQAGKSRVYVSTQQLVREGRLILPNDPRLLDQLRRVVAKPLPGGGLSISTPRTKGSAHGDIVSALTIACWRAAFYIDPECRKTRIGGPRSAFAGGWGGF